MCLAKKLKNRLKIFSWVRRFCIYIPMIRGTNKITDLFQKCTVFTLLFCEGYEEGFQIFVFTFFGLCLIKNTCFIFDFGCIKLEVFLLLGGGKKFI